MTEPKDDGGPFHSILEVRGNGAPGASFRAVAAMHAMAALLGSVGLGASEFTAQKAVEMADALVAELKK